MKYLPILLIVILYGCFTMPGAPGYISTTTSEFDGTKEINMEPAWLYDSAIKLSLFKSSKMPNDKIVLTAVVKGTHSFAPGNSLKFNIDNKIIEFTAIDDFTNIETTEGFAGSGQYIPPANWSSKDYIVTPDFIQRLVNANKVWVKIELEKSYIEGEFSTDAPTTARPAFKKFLEMI